MTSIFFRKKFLDSNIKWRKRRATKKSSLGKFKILTETHHKLCEPTMILVLGKVVDVFSILEWWISSSELFPHRSCLWVIIRNRLTWALVHLIKLEFNMEFQGKIISAVVTSGQEKLGCLTCFQSRKQIVNGRHRGVNELGKDLVLDAFPFLKACLKIINRDC